VKTDVVTAVDNSPRRIAELERMAYRQQMAIEFSSPCGESRSYAS
jgi:hypothetical protein